MDKILELLESLPPTAVAAAALILAALLGGLVFVKLGAIHYRARIARRSDRGRRLEDRAGRLLAAAGFHILGEQVPGEVTVRVDGEEIRSTVHADFIVRKGGVLYAADSKSGAAAANPGRTEARRQLLEYCLVYGCDRGLIVDMERESIREVELDYPCPIEPGLGRAGAFFLSLFSAGLGALAAWAVQ